MLSDAVIKVQDICKSFHIYNQPQDRLKQVLHGKHRKYYNEFWALKDISFEVKKGETVGIVGRNGSGKSTLLQIVAGTLRQTTGTVSVQGRVTALLELGSGFNPDFTGRENVYMNGTILGLKKEEIDSFYEEIAAFAEIGDFIDRPVKTYSNGMIVRLAFAVQVVIPKEILIVDEALAVGDELFQRKCYAKMEDFRRQGGTVLFVSHSGATVVELCNKAILLDQGEQLLMGESKKVVNLYQKLIYAPNDKKEQIREDIRSQGIVQLGISDMFIQVGHEQSREQSLGELQADYDESLVPKDTLLYESRGAEIFDVEIVTMDGRKANILNKKQKYIWRYKVRFLKTCTNVRFGMLIKALNGFEIGGSATAATGYGIPVIAEDTVMRVEFTFSPKLTAGVYFLNAGVLEVTEQEEVYLARGIDLAAFRIGYTEISLATAIVDFGITSEVMEESRKEDYKLA